MIDWIPGIRHENGSGSSSWMPLSRWAFMLHTAEGPSVNGTIAALRAKNAWSHFVYDPKTDELVQCVSLNEAARSLRSGGNAGRTNAARVIQVEIVGYAAESPNWTPQMNANIGKMIAKIQKYVPFKLEAPYPFYGNDAGFIVASETARQRLSWVEWYRFNGICGHQHAPKNSHWDPGKINIGAILAAAKAAAGETAVDTPQKDSETYMSPEQEARIIGEIKKLQIGVIAEANDNKAFRKWVKENLGSVRGWVKATATKVEADPDLAKELDPNNKK